MSLTLVKMLYCGQGMTTLVEVYGGDKTENDPADYLALVDCGGEKDYGGKQAVDYIANKVDRSRNKRLDLVVISHQDDDHHSLLKLLGEKIRGKKPGLIFICGSGWKETNIKSVRGFSEAVGYDLSDQAFNPEEMTHPATLGNYSDEVLLRLLVSNARTGSKNVVNGTSAVVAVCDQENAIILPGDATHETMSEIVALLTPKPSLLPPVAALSLPHHGALNTAVPNFTLKKKEEQLNWKPIDDFAGAVKPKHIAASARPEYPENRSWRHPRWEIVARFKEVDMQAPPHRFTTGITYPWADGTSGPVTVETCRSVWTTFSDLGGDNLVRDPGCQHGPPPSGPEPPKKKSRRAAVYHNIVFKLTPPCVQYRPPKPSTPLRPADAMVFAPAP